MKDDWYPSEVKVGPEGTRATYGFMEKIFRRESNFSYAELGIYRGDTARNVCERFPNCSLYLFDFFSNLELARKRLSVFGNEIQYYGSSQRFNDSYNWNLLKLIEANKNHPIFDYCFLDGAHTFAIDGLSFFLCDRLTRVGGYLDFDDYGWTLRGSSLDPNKIPEIADQYTDEQIDSKQVALIIENLVRPDFRYREIVKNKIFQKIA